MPVKEWERTRGLLGQPTTPLVLGAGAASLKRELPPPVPVKHDTPLRMNLAGDLIAAFGASVGVAPFITIADRAIMQVGQHVGRDVYEYHQTLMVRPARGTWSNKYEYSQLTYIFKHIKMWM